MIPRIKTGNSFKGAGLYYLHDKKREGEQERLTTERVAWTYARNTMEEEPQAVLAEMRQTAHDQSLLKHLAGNRPDGRPTERTVMTVALAWSPEQNPTREEMLEAGVSYLTHMGWDEHQVLFVAHNDTKHSHVHLIVNRIHPTTGMTLDDTWSKRRSQRWALGYEREHGRIFCEAREAKYDRSQSGGPDNMNYREWREWQELSKDRLFDPDFKASVEAGEWTMLKQAHRQERLSYWRETGQLRRELRASLREQVREEFAEEWEQYAKVRDARYETLDVNARETTRAIGRRSRQGGSGCQADIDKIKKGQSKRREELRGELAEMRKDIASRQKDRLEELAVPALEKLSKDRLDAYKDVLARHRADNAELRRDQAEGTRRPDLLVHYATNQTNYQPRSANNELDQKQTGLTPRRKKPSRSALASGQERRPSARVRKNPSGIPKKSPKRDGLDLLAGTGLSAIGKIADSLESLFETKPAKQQDSAMDQEGDAPTPPRDSRPTQAEELEQKRKLDLEFYLQQRDRERHRDRGR